MYRNKKATFCEEYRFFKWYLQESNRGHTDFQSDALPTELRHLAYLRVQRYVLLLKLPNVRQLFIKLQKDFVHFLWLCVPLPLLWCRISLIVCR